MTPETLTRAEAHRKLLALGMSADVAADYLDSEASLTARLAVSLACPGAWPILEAYRRNCVAHEGIVERAIRLDREATARACRPDLTPDEEAETVWTGVSIIARESTPAPVTDADLAEIEARTSGPGPLAEDSALLRRCVAEIRRLRAWQKNAVQDIATKTREWQQRGTEVRELDAEVDRWKTAVVSKAAERDVAVTENGRLRSEVERLTAKLAGIEGVAAQGDGMMATISEQAAEIERLTRTAGQRDQEWRAACNSHSPEEARAEVDRLTAELAGVRASYQAREAEWREGRVVFDPSERAPADASLEARAKIAMLAHDASPPAVFGGPWENAAPECHAAWIAVVRAVDASRPGLMCAECHRSVGRDVAHIDCEAPELGLVSDEHGYRAGSVDSAVATVVRAMGRPGLTEEEALATAGPLSRDIYNRIGLATGNKIGAPEWMRDAIATALLRASRGALARGDVAVPRAALESLVKATQYEDDVRDAREVAKRVLHQDFLRHEPARTDPEAARALAEARAERDSGDASLEADDPSPIERLAREFDRAAFKQGCGAINHDRGDCYRDAAKRVRAVAAEYLGLTEEQAGNVQSVRRRLGLTQERLGVEIGYRGETISRWENGHEAVPRVVRLALIGLIASHGEPDANRGAK